MNLFLGKPALGQLFPYPLDSALDEERRSMLQMVLPPIAKFLEEVNDPFKFVDISCLLTKVKYVLAMS